MSKLNLLLDSPDFSDEYLKKIIERKETVFTGTSVLKNVAELNELNEKIGGSYIIDLENNEKNSLYDNYVYLLKRLLDPLNFLLFKGDSIEVFWIDKKTGYSFTLDKSIGNYPLFHKEILNKENQKVYNIRLNKTSIVNLIQKLHVDSEFLYKLLIREIFAAYQKNSFKKRSKADVDFYLRTISPQEVIQLIMVANPDSEIESHGKEFFRDYQLDHLLEIYRELSK